MREILNPPTFITWMRQTSPHHTTPHHTPYNDLQSKESSIIAYPRLMINQSPWVGFCIFQAGYLGQQIAVTVQRVIYTKLLLDQSLIWVNLILFAVTWYTGPGYTDTPPTTVRILSKSQSSTENALFPLFFAIKLISPMQWNGSTLTEYNRMQTSNFPG